MKNTILYGGPGSGKTTRARGMFRKPLLVGMGYSHMSTPDLARALADVAGCDGIIFDDCGSVASAYRVYCGLAAPKPPAVFVTNQPPSAHTRSFDDVEVVRM